MITPARSMALFSMAFLLGAAGPLPAQIGTDPNLVYVHVAVTNRDDRFVTGLAAESFKVVEESTPQSVEYFSDQEVPITAAVLLDVRPEMKEPLTSSVFGALEKFSTPDDRFFRVDPAGAPLSDLVYQGLNQLLRQGGGGRRAFLLITDRYDPASTSFAKVRQVLRDQAVQFFVIVLPQRPDVPGNDPSLMRELAELTGGRAFVPRNITQVELIGRTVVQQLRHQYVLGYRPTNAGTRGEWRAIEVSAELRDPTRTMKFKTHSKAGYYAPTVVTPAPAK